MTQKNPRLQVGNPKRQRVDRMTRGDGDLRIRVSLNPNPQANLRESYNLQHTSDTPEIAVTSVTRLFETRRSRISSAALKTAGEPTFGAASAPNPV